MRRNHNRNLHSQKVISPLVGRHIILDKREINKEIEDGFFKRVYDRVMKIGGFLKKVFWGSPTLQPAFARPTRDVGTVPARVINKRKSLRHMQRDSRRANRG